MDANTLQSYINFCLPDGRAALVGILHEYKKAYGSKWLEKFKEENGDFVFIVDIVVNHEGQKGFEALAKAVSTMIDEAQLPLWQEIPVRTLASTTLHANQENILDTLRALRAEIDKPRF